VKRLLFRMASRGRLSILAFHAVPRNASVLRPDELTAAEFEERLLELKKFLSFMPLSEGVRRLRAGTLPQGAACITLDDGYASWMDGVVPALERLSLTATLFITTGQLHGRMLWNERLHRAVDATAEGAAPLRLVWQGQLQTFDLATLDSKKQSILRLEQFIKYQPSDEREDLISALEAHCGITHDGGNNSQELISRADVLSLHRRGFEIGAHTDTHPILMHCSDAEARREIGRSREVLGDLLGVPVAGFAYPNGQPGTDFGQKHIEMVREAGFSYAVSTVWGSARDSSDVFALPRFTPWGPGPLKTFAQMSRNLLYHPVTAPCRQDTAPDPRVLMVAFHFPPQAGSSGMLRTLNFAKYLPASGWRVTVLTAGPSAYERISMDLMPEVPPACTVLRAPALDSARHLAVRGKYLSVTAVPDRWVTWLPSAWWRGWRECRRAASAARPYAVVWSTFPIATAHLVGGLIARTSGLPWVADFRDPMTAPGYPAGRFRRVVTQWVERFTFANASACVFTTDAAAQSYANRYPATAQRLYVVENGYDESAFAATQPRRLGVAFDKLLMVHSGGIYPGDRDPSALFDAVAQLLAEGEIAADRVCIRFRASGHDPYVRDLAARYRLDAVVELAPPVPYREAIAEMMGADLLLLFQGTQFNRQIPAKLYEYVRAGRPVLGLIDPCGQTADVIRRYPGHLIASISNADEIKTRLKAWLSDRDSAAHKSALARSMELVKASSRESQAAQLAGLLAGQMKAPPSISGSAS
jgi:peptidoglycan/xylan/chitin deacetylase (PgdA/CDA1 family)/glycosyltransferase involved in cell wall biosynthesis